MKKYLSKNKCIMLDLVFKTGSRYAISYSHISEVSFSNGDNLQISTPSKRVNISGIGLENLYDAILTSTLPTIEEISSVDSKRNQSGVRVDSIKIQQK